MRFIHISGTHIGPTENYEIFGSKPYPRLNSLIDHLNRIPLKYDFLVHTGDIVETGSETSYLLARTLFTKIDKPIYFLPGNHDKAILVEKHLFFEPLNYINERSDKSYIIEKDGYQLLFLHAPTSAEKPAHGSISDSTLELVRKYILKSQMKSLVFVHYPPLALDSKWLNSEMILLNGKELHDLLKISGSNVEAVFFGHAHKGMQVIRDGVFYVSTGSTFCQFNAWPDASEPEFAAEEPAYYNIVTAELDQLTIKNHAIF